MLTTDPYTTILKNQIQKATTGENQLPATKERTILHTLSTICGVVDVSKKLKPFEELTGISFFLLWKSWNMETNSLI